ncbi:hypothetical protein ABZW02_17610 [Streptomyces sp. NPDC005180]|uniref:hypothetical protein n=1 Tax=Streptomyces sp. NPDC005180 TaxID=3156868 RepID=UPI0033AAD408
MKFATTPDRLAAAQENTQAGYQAGLRVRPSALPAHRAADQRQRHWQQLSEDDPAIRLGPWVATRTVADSLRTTARSSSTTQQRPLPGNSGRSVTRAPG